MNRVINCLIIMLITGVNYLVIKLYLKETWPIAVQSNQVLQMQFTEIFADTAPLLYPTSVVLRPRCAPLRSAAQSGTDRSSAFANLHGLVSYQGLGQCYTFITPPPPLDQSRGKPHRFDEIILSYQKNLIKLD